MEELTVTGIVLKTTKYKEKDKLINIFTVELGNITASLKGVSSNSAKLKFAGQLFCFGKFDLVKSKDFYVVKNVELIDSFFDLASDYDNYMYASSYLEVCNYILRPNILSENLFIKLLKTLNNIVYNSINIYLSSIKFYCEFLQIIGYKLNFDVCDNCGLKFVGDIKFDFQSGTFRCMSCSNGCIISKQIFTTLKIIDGTSIDRLHTLKLNNNILKESLDLIVKNVSYRINYKIKSIK